MKTSSQSVEIPRPQIRLVDTVLIHLLRNAVAHGIEPMDERRVLGKDPVGSISIDVQMTESANLQTISIDVAVDGRGISVEKFRKFAVANGNWTEAQAAAATDDEVFNLLFLQDFTLANEVDLNAGRGVGLDAVKEAVDALGGRLVIQSELRVGTRFKLTFEIADTSGAARV